MDAWGIMKLYETHIRVTSPMKTRLLVRIFFVDLATPDLCRASEACKSTSVRDRIQDNNRQGIKEEVAAEMEIATQRRFAHYPTLAATTVY